MTLMELFNEKICAKSKCEHFNDQLTIPHCFGNPTTCKVNKKAGYPKEHKEVEG